MSKVKLFIFIVLALVGVLVILGSFFFKPFIAISDNEMSGHILEISLGLLLIALGGLILGS